VLLVIEQFGPYELLRVVGRGGMGEVFEAHDTEHDRIVALKRLVAEAAGDDEFQRRFRREARLAARLSSPHVIPIHRHGEIDGRLFLDMRLVAGADLEQVLQKERRLAPARAVAIIEQVASALDAAHHASLIHRDVKPSNVLIDGAVGANDFVYLADFGITRSIGGDESVALTGTRSLVGSLDYMAPERFSGQGGAAIDIYALGCLLFECLTGSRPFPVDGINDLMTAHLTWAPPTPSRSVAGLSEAFDAVIASSLAKDPEQRPASAGDLAAAARAALDAASGTSVPSTPATAERTQDTADPTTGATPRRGGTQVAAAPPRVDVPTTTVPAVSTVSALDPTATMRSMARPPAVNIARGLRTSGPGGPPPRNTPRGPAPGPSSGNAIQPMAVRAGGSRGAGARPAPPPSGDGSTTDLRVGGPPAGRFTGSANRPTPPAPASRPFPSAPATGSAPSASITGPAQSAPVPRPAPSAPATSPAPSAPATAPAPSDPPAGRGAARKALWVALWTLGAVVLVAVAVYVAVLLTPAAG
jgi:serine/threonine-protein kinase